MRGIRLNDLIHTAGEGENSTIIQCVHEQSLAFFLSYLLPMDHLCTNRQLKQNNTQSSKPMKH